MIIKRIGVLKLAVFQATLMAAFGILAALFLMAAVSMIGMQSNMAFGGGLLGLIVFPIIYGVIGFITGALVAALYNLVASVVGGIEIDVE